MKKTLETNRLILRDFTLDDASDMYEYAVDDRVGPNAGWPIHESIEDTKKVLEMFLENDENYAVVLKDENKVIGSLGITQLEEKDGVKLNEIGYAFNPKYWGFGYATEAVNGLLKYLFEEEGVDYINCAHFDFNTASKNVIEKCGFKYTHNRNTLLPLMGRVYNTLVYTMTKDMYFENVYNMGFLKCIHTRYSVREFEDKSISEEQLKLILESARIAPTAVNFQPQRIIVVNKEEELKQLSAATRTYFNAKTILVVCHDSNVSWHRRADNKDHGIIDSSIVATYMMLTCTSLGLGTTYVSSFKDEIVREVLNIPDNYQINCLLPIGYIKEGNVPSESHYQRKDLEDIVFYGKLK